MTETLPVPTGAGPEPQVWLIAVAKAAAEMAAQEANRRKDGAPLTRDDVEEIATACAEVVVKRLFRDFVEVDLDSIESRRAFRDDLAYARKGRTWWDKALNIIVGAALGVFAMGLIAAVIKALPAALVAAGGVK